MNLNELGEITESEYDKEHRCEANKYPKFDRVIHCVSTPEGPLNAWQLHNLHFADEQEVELGEAEFVDELTYHSAIEINFCPFCGERL